MEAGRLRVGTSGWAYRHWRGVLYPPGLPQSRWREAYQARFDTVELNTTFYGLPAERTVRQWAHGSPEGFTYAVKGSRYVTHVLRLRDAEAAIARLVERVRLLGPHLGPLLWQLPPDFARDLERLAAFLEVLPAGLRHAVEFRHASWSGGAMRELLASHGVAPARTYASGYSDAELHAWALRMRRWLDGGRDVYAYFNNDIGGHAVRDASRLLAELQPDGARPLEPMSAGGTPAR
jgi:uncharacterized protein YecE (DUF72 family)